MTRYKLPAGIGYTSSGIPKIFHQIWIGSVVPPALKPIMSTFKKMEGYKYKLWKNRDLTAENFPITWKYIQFIKSQKKVVFAMIADLMRLEILYHHGGVYIDTTAFALKNFDGILENSAKFIMSNEMDCGLNCKSRKGKYISNSFIASVPQYKVLERLLSDKKLSMIDFSSPANVATGPYYVRTGITRASDVKMLPTSLIYPENSIDKCVFEERSQAHLKKLKYLNDKVYYLKIPCTTSDYPKAYMAKSWMIGGTWIEK